LLSGKELYLMDFEYGYYCADLIQDNLQKTEDSPDLIGWHGHTIFHDPDRQSSLQIGQPCAIAGKTGLPVVGDLRLLDLALGGQGAPLAPVADMFLMTDARGYLNLGGICNVTLMKDGGSMIAFDVCPCSQVLNGLAEQLGLSYDKDGLLARKGEVNSKLLSALNGLDYYRQRPPKSIDNNWIRSMVWPVLEAAEIKTEDKLRTCCHHIVEQIGNSLLVSGIDSGDVLISGGGAHNVLLIELLSDHLEQLGLRMVKPHAEVIEYKEAAFIGLMAFYFCKLKTNVFAAATGSTRDHVAGSLFQGWKKQVWIDR